MDKEKFKGWTIEVGFYPGLLFGIRTYEEPDQTAIVLYIPFVDLAFTLFR